MEFAPGGVQGVLDFFILALFDQAPLSFFAQNGPPG